MAHITGGGLIDNIPRILPKGLSVQIDIGGWKKIPIFGFLTKALDLKNEDLNLLTQAEELMRSTNFGSFPINKKRGKNLGSLCVF